MDSKTQQYYQELEASVETELRLQDPVAQRLKLIYFVSKSKGRGRKRKHWEEISLVQDKWNGKCTSLDNYPFDVYASEILPGVLDAEAELRRRLYDYY